MPQTSTNDQAVVRQILDVLRNLNGSAAKSVAIEVVDGVLTLRGPVDTFYTKQVFLHYGRQASGVAAVVDELRVER